MGVAGSFLSIALILSSIPLMLKCFLKCFFFFFPRGNVESRFPSASDRMRFGPHCLTHLLYNIPDLALLKIYRGHVFD